MGNPNTERKNRRGRELRSKVIEMLGGKCSLCGSTERLEIDHPNGRDWQPNRTSQARRANRYLEEAKAGHVRVLCRACNRKLSNERRAYGGTDIDEDTP